MGRLFHKWFDRLKSILQRMRSHRLRFNIIIILSFYFVIVLATQILYGTLNFNDVIISNKRQDIETTEKYLKQAALDLKLDLDRVEQISSLLYNEYSYYLNEQTQPSIVGSEKREFNTIIDLIFRTNLDIPGITIYTQHGGMLSYSNPYSTYYFLSGSTSLYSELLTKTQNKTESLLLSRKYEGENENLLSAKFFQTEDGKNNSSIIVIEKNWGSMKQYFKDLGLLNMGSIVLISEEGNVLFSLRTDTANTGLENSIRNGDVNQMFTDLSGVFQAVQNDQEKYVFYNKSVYSGCNLLYITDSESMSGYKSTTIMFIIITSIVLFAVNSLVVFLFIKNIYKPIINAESTLKEIVSGNTNLKIHDVKMNNELYPLYTDLHSLTENLKNLINSEYAAKIMKKQAEIDSLQNQINPHFLYNTLDSIRGQAISEGSENIEKMVKALSDLFRYSISNIKSMVTLEEELKNIDNYLNIQQFRFNNRFKILKEIDSETLKIEVPKLIIQPLVENAIKHGLETKIGKGTIVIRSRITKDKMVINVEDDGEGIDIENLQVINQYLANGVNPNEVKNIRIGVGLININERIKMIYNSNSGLKIYSMKGIGTNAELSIPIIKPGP